MKDGDVGGAVYVYINQEGRWDRITPVRLNGTKDSMFGLAVENIGDINQDSYNGNSAVGLYLILWFLYQELLEELFSFCFSYRYCHWSSLC